MIAVRREKSTGLPKEPLRRLRWVRDFGSLTKELRDGLSRTCVHLMDLRPQAHFLIERSYGRHRPRCRCRPSLSCHHARQPYRRFPSNGAVNLDHGISWLPPFQPSRPDCSVCGLPANLLYFNTIKSKKPVKELFHSLMISIKVCLARRRCGRRPRPPTPVQ